MIASSPSELLSILERLDLGTGINKPWLAQQLQQAGVGLLPDGDTPGLKVVEQPETGSVPRQLSIQATGQDACERLSGLLPLLPVPGETRLELVQRLMQCYCTLLAQTVTQVAYGETGYIHDRGSTLTIAGELPGAAVPAQYAVVVGVGQAAGALLDQQRRTQQSADNTAPERRVTQA